MAVNQKGSFVTPQDIDEFLEDVASGFEVPDTSDEGKCLVLLIGIFMGYFTFLQDFFAFEKEIFR